MRELANRIGHEACTGVGLEAAGQARNQVWHTVMAAHPDDGMLTDAQWQEIARRLMRETGLHPDGSGEPVPWVAGEWHDFWSVNLNEIVIKGTPGDVVTVIGGTW